MPVKTVRDEKRDLQKQIGCMNGIFQLFDRHHFLAGRRSGHRMLLQVTDTQHQQCTKATVVEKPRTSTESSRASYSSSTCSTSTLSSLDCSRTAYQPEQIQLRPISIPHSKLHPSATKEEQQQPSLAQSNRRGSPMNHIDSPRPSLLLNSDVKKQKFKDDRMALPRFSYDGRESQETAKFGLRYKERPRLSLDSKTSSMKSSALESRSNVLVREQKQNVKNHNSQEVLPSDQEPGSHHRSSSIVAKLMGLEVFPDAMVLSESQTPTLKSAPEEDFHSQLAYQSKPNQGIFSPRHLTEASPRLLDKNPVRKCSKLPAESAPWRQQDCSQSSPRTFFHNRKAATNAPQLPLSVYGEIEKRIAVLEFKKSGKDLRALKQILDAMEKTRERMENQIGESTEPTMQKCNDSCSDQSSNLSMPDDRKIYHQVPANGCSTWKVKDKVTAEMSRLHRLQTQGPKYHRENTTGRQKDKDLSPKSNLKDHSRHHPSPSKKTTWRTSEMDRSPAKPRSIKFADCTSPRKGAGMTSPRLQHNPLRIGKSSHSAAPLSDTKEIKKYCSKPMIEKGYPNRKHEVKAKDIQISDDQSSETRHSSYQVDTASVKSKGNNSIVSQTDKEIMNLPHETTIKVGHNENAMLRMRKHVKAVGSVLTMVEQPSPISVLDEPFYCEGSPSPVKKTSKAFQGDIPCPGEEEWNLENPKHLTEYRRLNNRCKHNQKSEGLKHTVHGLNFLPNETTENDSILIYDSHNQDHRYITKILMISGLLKCPNFISATDQQLLPSCHLINPDVFHVIEQTEEGMEDSNGRVTSKNEKMKLDKKIRRKIIFDMVDEILVRKINSGRFAVRKKMPDPQILLKEIYSEMNLACRRSNSNLDNAKDETVKVLTADLNHQSEDWASHSGEVPALVLDIERQIFKDLITEVVTGEVMELHNQTKRHCRQLFRH